MKIERTTSGLHCPNTDEQCEFAEFCWQQELVQESGTDAEVAQIASQARTHTVRQLITSPCSLNRIAGLEDFAHDTREIFTQIQAERLLASIRVANALARGTSVPD